MLSTNWTWMGQFWVTLLLSKINILKHQSKDTKKGKPSQQPIPQKQRGNYRSEEESTTKTHKNSRYNKGNNNKEHNNKKIHNKRLAYYKQNNKRTQYMRLANYKKRSESISSQICLDQQMVSRHNREPIFNWADDLLLESV